MEVLVSLVVFWGLLVGAGMLFNWSGKQASKKKVDKIRDIKNEISRQLKSGRRSDVLIKQACYAVNRNPEKYLEITERNGVGGATVTAVTEGAKAYAGSVAWGYPTTAPDKKEALENFVTALFDARSELWHCARYARDFDLDVEDQYLLIFSRLPKDAKVLYEKLNDIEFYKQIEEMKKI